MRLARELRTYGSLHKGPVVQEAELLLAWCGVGFLLVQMGVTAFARLLGATSQLNDLQLSAANAGVGLALGLGLLLILLVIYRNADKEDKTPRGGVVRPRERGHMVRQRVYRSHERHEYEPAPCPCCGDTEPHVNWIDVSAHDDPDAWVPGLLTCTNEECPGQGQ